MIGITLNPVDNSGTTTNIFREINLNHLTKESNFYLVSDYFSCKTCDNFEMKSFCLTIVNLRKISWNHPTLLQSLVQSETLLGMASKWLPWDDDMFWGEASRLCWFWDDLEKSSLKFLLLKAQLFEVVNFSWRSKKSHIMQRVQKRSLRLQKRRFGVRH